MTGSASGPGPEVGDRPPATGVAVGVDDSAPSVAAYRWAATRSARFGPVTPVAAWQYPWWYFVGAPMIAPDGPGPDIERDARRVVDDLVARGPEAPRREPVVARGAAGHVLVEVAGDVGLLVVGTRGRGPVADHLLGSVSSYCAAHSPVPLVIVPEHWSAEPGPAELVLVGYDGSAGADAALDWALGYCRPEDRLVAFQAWDIPVITGYESIAIDPEVVRAATLEVTTAGAAAACQRAGVPDDRIEVRVGEGDARSVLEQLGADADLVVVGRKGHGRLAHAVLGSVTTSLVHRPVTPIAVVPPAAS